MLALTLAVLAAAPDRPCVDTTDPLRSFATCFDPWRGLWLGSGAVAQSGAVELSVTAELRLRKERESFSKADSTWLAQHRIAATRWEPRAARVDATAWEFVFRRHAAETFLTLPTVPVTRLPFPFDIGLSGSAARFEWGARASERWALETARLAFLFDPLRAQTSRFHLGFGPVAQHRLAVDGGGGVTHEVSALTSGLLVLRAETSDGFLFVRSTTLGGAALELEGATVGWRPNVRADAEAGLVLLAVNDQPLVLCARGELWWRGGPAVEWSASLALGLRLFSARRA